MLPLRRLASGSGAARLAHHRRAVDLVRNARHVAPLCRAYTTVDGNNVSALVNGPDKRQMSTAAESKNKIPYKKFKRILVANRGEIFMEINVKYVKAYI